MNPWADLIRPIRSRPGDALPTAPAVPQPVRAAFCRVHAAAAMVVTKTGIFDRPDVRLIPIIAVEFVE